MHAHTEFRARKSLFELSYIQGAVNIRFFYFYLEGADMAKVPDQTQIQFVPDTSFFLKKKNLAKLSNLL